MKLTVFLLCSLFFITSVRSQTVTLNEDFQTGLPTSAPTVETSVTLSSGIWRLQGSFGGSDNGSVRLRMNTNGYAITPSINKPVSVSFDHRGSGSGKVLTVDKSVNNGTTWTTIGSVTVSSSSTYGSSSFAVAEAGTRNVLLRFRCNSATIFVDNVRVTSSEMGDEPTLQASLSASNITGSSVHIQFGKGDGAGRLLVYAQGSAPSWMPEDGTHYTNLPKLLTENVLAVFTGNANEITVSGLSAGETYHFAVFEYTNENNTPNYLTSTVGRLQVRTSDVPTFTVSPTAVHFGSVKTNTTAMRSITLSGRFLQTSPAEMVTIRGSEEFLVSTQQSSGFSTVLHLPLTTDTLSPLTIYVQFVPKQLQLYTHTLTIQGGQAQASVALLGTGSVTDAKVYYIAPWGNDTNLGTYDSPWFNLQRAVNAMVPGDTIICRGGVYFPTMMQDGTKTTVRLNARGSADKWFTIKNYPGEFPVFNFRSQPKRQSVRGIQLNGTYWHIFGLHITEAGDNGMKIEGSFNRIERCTFSYNDDTGLQLGFGHNFSDSGLGSSNDGTHCAYNDIIDCDAYLNCDSDNFGADADGFAAKMHNGIGNRFIRCRAWDNADDAWDMFTTAFAVYLIECWAWGSGRASNFGWVQASGSFQGNGNGIKLGGNGPGGPSRGIHEVWNSVAFNNNKTGSVKGFDQNSHQGGEKIINCLAFGNGYDFMFEQSAANRSYFNNVCFGRIEIAAGSTESHNAMLSTSNQAWNNNIIRGFSMSDYVSLTEEDAKAPRGADGSMPKRFARLRPGSVLIDRGLPQNIPFVDEFPFLAQPMFGAGRDLGPYEYYDANFTSLPQIILNQQAQLNLEILPNPSSVETVLKFSADRSGTAHIVIYSLAGKPVKNAVTMNVDSGIEYYIPLMVSDLENGTYLCKMYIGTQSKTQKLIVIR